MLELVKKALRVTKSAFDDELNMLIAACLQEMAAMNVNVAEPYDEQVKAAVVAYCKWQFGNNEDKDQWREIYDRKLAEMKMMTGLTTWESTEA